MFASGAWVPEAAGAADAGTAQPSFVLRSGGSGAPGRPAEWLATWRPALEAVDQAVYFRTFL